MKLENLYLTEELLFDFASCREINNAIDFIKRNKLIGFPIARLSEVEGDYKNYIYWIETKIKHCEKIIYTKREEEKKENEIGDKLLYEIKIYSHYTDTKTFDSNGNLIKTTRSNSHDLWTEYKYDAKNRLIKHSDSTGYFKNIIYDGDNIIEINYSSGYFEKYDYDGVGNQIKNENSDGYWVKRKYDKNNNMIELTDHTGYWEKKKYDIAGNQISFKNSKGVVNKLHTTFYDNGQLKSIDNLKIPKF